MLIRATMFKRFNQLTLSGNAAAYGAARSPMALLPRRWKVALSDRRAFSAASRSYLQSKTEKDYSQLMALPDVNDKEVNLATLLEDFRQLYVVETYNHGHPKPNLDGQSQYRYGERALFALMDQNPSRVFVKVSSLAEIIPPGYGRVWSAVKQRADGKNIDALEGWDAKVRAILLFMRVYGVGRKKAENWVEKGARTLQDLLALDPPKAQKLGIKYFEDIEKLIPRRESDQFKSLLDEALGETDSELEGEIMGSYRRGKTYSSDIDYVVRHKEFDGKDEERSRALLSKVVEHLRERGIIIDEPLAFGPQKYMGFAKVPGSSTARRIDIRLVGNSSYFLYLFAFTGDLELMKYARARAASKGLFLNEYGLGKRLLAADRGMQKGSDTWDPDHLIPINSEEDIFDALEMNYVPPEKRGGEDWTKILPRDPY